ncbi:GIY-YIG nuclease family protein [Shewanella maritima]|nr:GIY-YIG nuclease family protein [Shewanella maritima]
MMANKKDGSIYIGVTSNLINRVYQHKAKLVKSHTQKYNINLLVYYEVHDEIGSAIEREKKLKRWRRSWKCQLIEKQNPDWLDLYQEIL